MKNSTKKRLDLLVQRQLDNINSGNGAYLETFLRVVKASDLETRVIFAPYHSFGNRPWSKIHPRLSALIDKVEWPRSIRVGSTYWSVSLRVWTRFFIRAFKELGHKLGLPKRISSYLGRPMNSAENKAIARVCNPDPADITIAEYSSMGPVLDLISSNTRRGVFMHDLLSDRAKIWRERGKIPDLYEATLEEEVNWCRSADLMIYASANELDKFQKELSNSKAVWLRPEPPSYKETTSTGTPHIVFLGTTHTGNTDALHHFLEDIWPSVRSQRPDLELWVAGSVGNTLSRDEKAQPGVKVLGRVEQLEQIGGSDSIGIAPTRLATGISIKVAEYLMLDMTCVAYPLALDGFKSKLDHLVKIAGDEKEFADAILELASDHELRFSSAAKSRREAELVLSNQAVVDFLKEATLEKEHGLSALN